MFTYITGNTNKIASARERLSKAGIEFTHQKLDIVERMGPGPSVWDGFVEWYTSKV